MNDCHTPEAEMIEADRRGGYAVGLDSLDARRSLAVAPRHRVRMQPGDCLALERFFATR
jgi:hypothetical protein